MAESPTVYEELALLIRKEDIAERHASFLDLERKIDTLSGTLCHAESDEYCSAAFRDIPRVFRCYLKNAVQNGNLDIGDRAWDVTYALNQLLRLLDHFMGHHPSRDLQLEVMVLMYDFIAASKRLTVPPGWGVEKKLQEAVTMTVEKLAFRAETTLVYDLDRMHSLVKSGDAKFLHTKMRGWIQFASRIKQCDHAFADFQEHGYGNLILPLDIRARLACVAIAQCRKLTDLMTECSPQAAEVLAQHSKDWFDNTKLHATAIMKQHSTFLQLHEGAEEPESGV